MARRVRAVDAAYLSRVALWYIERWDSPAASLRRVLMRRVRRSAEAHGTDPDQGARWVEEIVARLIREGLVNDANVAERLVRQGRQRGWSRRRIASSLASRGLGADDVTSALAAIDGEACEPEQLAALRLARRRRIGPWRVEALDPDRRTKELAILARGGFSYALAVRVVDQIDRSDADASLLIG